MGITSNRQLGRTIGSLPPPTPTATQTVTRTRTTTPTAGIGSPTPTGSGTPTLTVTPTVAPARVGDCNADRAVKIEELILGVGPVAGAGHFVAIGAADEIFAIAAEELAASSS